MEDIWLWWQYALQEALADSRNLQLHVRVCKSASFLLWWRICKNGETVEQVAQ